MAVIEDIDFKLDAVIGGSVSVLVSKVLEQKAQLADNQINQTLLMEVVAQFVESERKLAEAHAEVLALSRTDALTGIANRRCFDEALALELARAIRSQTPIGLLLMDIDCFKLFNDNYGHAAGDDCLRLVAQAAQGVVRRLPDLAARYGGEELACILPGTGAAGMAAVGKILLEAVEGLGIPHSFSTAAKVVTVSMGGISVVPPAGMTAKQLIEAVDKRLYISKTNGRNRLTVDGPTEDGGR